MNNGFEPPKPPLVRPCVEILDMNTIGRNDAFSNKFIINLKQRREIEK